MTCVGSPTNDSTAIQAAINVGITVRIHGANCNIATALSPQSGQIIQGDGPAKTALLVPSSFSVASLGVFICPGAAARGPLFRDLGIYFAQVDTSSRASLIAFPPAIYCQASPSFEVHNVDIGRQ